MKRLSRYLFVECSVSLIAVLMIMTFLALLPQVLQLVDLWVNKGVSIGILGQMTALIIPKFVVRSLPMALLIAILITLGRLSQDSEIVVLKASGISLYQMARPIAALVLIATLLSLWLNWVWVPQTRQSFAQIRMGLITSTNWSVKPQTFTEAISDLTLYVQKQSMEGILIHDQRNRNKPVTLVAQYGQLYKQPDGSSSLFLKNGSRHQMTATGGYQQLIFSSYDMELGVTLGIKLRKQKKKLEQYSPMQVVQATKDENRHWAYKARMEFHRRLAYPAAALVLGLLAIPLGIQSHRAGRSYGFVAAIRSLIL